MKLEIPEAILKDTIAACNAAFIKTCDTKFLAVFTFWLNMEAAEKYRKETQAATIENQTS